MQADNRPVLLRQLDLQSAIALVVSNMVGTAIFTSLGYNAGDLGDPVLVLCLWIVGAVCALAGALCYSELGVNFPSSGGEYVYLTRAYGPEWGFMTGWISFVAGFSAPIVTSGFACAAYLSHFVPALHPDQALIALGWGSWSIKVGWAQTLVVAVVALFSALNIVGLKWSGQVQKWLTGLKIIIILGFIVLGFTIGDGNWEHFSQTTTRWNPQIPLSAQFVLSLFWVYVGYSGWNAVTYVADEVKDPERTLPMAMLIGTSLVAVLFLLLNVVFIYAAPLESMKGVLAVGTHSAIHLFGEEVAGIFSLLMAVSLLATINSMVTVGPRVYYAMALNGAFLSGAGKLHPRYRTPAFAIVAQALMTFVAAIASFRDLINYIGFLLNFFATLAVASLFLFRRRPGWRKLRAVTFAYPLVPALFCVVGLWMTYQGFAREPRVSLTASATVAVGALIYRARIRGTES